MCTHTQTHAQTYTLTQRLTQSIHSFNRQGINHRIQFFLNPTSEHTQFYQVTQDGLLIARTNELMPSQKHRLEVSCGWVDPGVCYVRGRVMVMRWSDRAELTLL